MSGNDEERKKRILEVIEILKEIAFDRRMIVLRFLGTTITSIMKRIYQAVKVNETSLNRVSLHYSSNILISTSIIFS